MKKLSALAAVIALLTLCITSNAQTNNTKEKKTKGSMNASMDMPYTATYSSKFEMGNPKYSAIVLNAWKSYDDNNFGNLSDMVSDTVNAVLPDGTLLKGKENFINGIKGYRGGFSAARSEVVAYIPVKSLDKKDDIVFIWGDETDTKTDGSTQKVDLHEVWAFNKDGKLTFFKQFIGKSPEEPK